MSATGQLLAVALRGLRARAVLTVGSVLLAAIAVAAAVIGPVYQRAAAQSFMVNQLRATPALLTGWSLTWQQGTTLPAEQLAARSAQAADELLGEGYDHGHAFVVSEPTTARSLGPTGGRPTLLWSAGMCDHVRLSGRCPAASGDVALLRTDAADLGLSVGDAFRPWGDRRTLRVVATYLPPVDDGAYWVDPDRFASYPEVPASLANPGSPYRPAPFLTAPDSFGPGPVQGYRALVEKTLSVPPDLDPDRLRRVASNAVDLGKQASLHGDRLDHFAIGEGNSLDTVAHEVLQRRAVTGGTVRPAVVSLVLVALVLLLRLISAAMALRRGELALAGLRGYSRRRLWLLGLTEPLLVLAIAAPIGIVGGYVAVRTMARRWLVEGIEVPFVGGSVVAVVAVLVAGVLVSAGVVRAALAEPLSSRIAGVARPTAPGRVVLLAQLATGAAALVTLGVAWTGSRGAPDAADLLLPILLAVAAGLLAGLLARTAAGWCVRWTRRLRSLVALVASRAVSRRREGTLVALPLTAAVAVAVFATGVDGAAAGWRDSSAATEVGAARSFATTLTIDRAVRLTHTLDPDGRWLMAMAADYPVGADARVVVDAPRLGRVAAWPDQWTPGRSAAEIGAALAPTRPSVVLTGSRLSLTVDNRVRGEYDRLGVVVTLVDDRGDVTSVEAGAFGPGRSTTAVTRLPHCADGCVVTGLAFGGPAALTERMTGTATVSAMSVDGREVAGALDLPWRVLPSQAGTPSGVAGAPRLANGALTVRFDAPGNGSDATITPTDVPALTPVLFGRTAHVRPALSTGDSASTFPVRSIGSAESMPVLGPRGELLDYTMFRRSTSQNTGHTDVVVLARADTPPALLQQLSARGLGPERTEGGVRRVLDQDAFALALKLYLVVAALVVLLALAGLAVNLAVQLPSRRRDAASLRVVGVRKRVLMGAVVAELVVVLGAAVLAGVAAGWLSQDVVVRSLTLGFADDSRQPRVLASFDVAAALSLSATLFLVLVLAGTTVAWLTVRRARTSSLRENAR